MVKALELRSASHSPKGHLEGIEPIPQEFHKRGIALQVPHHLHDSQKVSIEPHELSILSIQNNLCDMIYLSNM